VSQQHALTRQLLIPTRVFCNRQSCLSLSICRVRFLLSHRDCAGPV
jgi:hypothetical protein